LDEGIDIKLTLGPVKKRKKETQTVKLERRTRRAKVGGLEKKPNSHPGERGGGGGG